VKEEEVLIIAGYLYVHPEERDRWVDAHHEVVQRARSQPGCIDLYFSADPVEPGRVNMFEQWETEDHLEAWRAIADPPPKPEILRADVQKHQISSSGPPF
jgi:heme-degrading monooxygenase HmoA